MGMDAQLSAILGDMETWQRPPPSRGKDSDARRDGDDYKHRPSSRLPRLAKSSAGRHSR